MLLLAACAPAPQPTATQLPLPTVTQAPTDTQVPTETEAPVVTPEVGSAQALEAILISMPGSGSQVASPVTVQGQSRPTFEQGLSVAVYGQDGQVLDQQPITIDAPAGQPGDFSASLTFDVPAEQPGRISVSETSAKDGGILHLASVEITLRPAGASANLLAAEFHFESIAIASPAINASVSGGTLTVSGYSDYYFESNLGLALCGEGGSGAPDELCGTQDNVLALGNATIDSPDVGQPGPFSGSLSYSVAGPVQARIVAFASSPRDGGWLHVSSIPIILQP